MNKLDISMNVVRRLPKYHGCLAELMEKGEKRVSSKELGSLTGFTSSQIRQDLNNFGGFGKQGYGYNVETLYNNVSEILGLNNFHPTIIIGAGNVGRAIANYQGFRDYCIDIKAIFDVNKDIIGKEINKVKIFSPDDMDEIIEKEKISIAIITTPKNVASKVADRLFSFKSIKGIWNFAPVDIKATHDVFVENVSLIESLYVLSFMIENKK